MSQSTIQLTEPTPESKSTDQVILLAAKGGGIAFAGNLFVYVIRFGFGVVIARLLGAELLGLYSLGTIFADVSATIAQLGFGAGIARYIPITLTQKDTARLRGIVQIGVMIPTLVSFGLAVATYLSANLISIQFYHQPSLAPVLRFFSWSIPMLALIGVLESVTQGYKRMEYKVFSEDITLNVVKLLFTVLLVGLGFGVMGAIGASLVSQLVTVIMLIIFVNHLFPLNQLFQVARRNTREMFHFTLPIYISQFVNQFSGSIGTLILGLFGTVSGVGIYTAALRVSDIGTLFHVSLMRIATPMISDLHSQGKIDQLQRMYQTMTKWGMAFNLPVFLTTVIFAPIILSIFGEDFIIGSTGLAILAFAALFNASTGVCGTIVTMTGHSKLSLANSISALVVTIGLDLLLIPRWGLMGAAVASALTVILLNITRLVEVYALHRIQPYNRSYIKPIIAAVVATGTSLLINNWTAFLPPILRFLVGALFLWGSYAASIVVLRLDAEDRMVLTRVWARITSR